MASSRWHKMNNTICEIERSTDKLEAAMCHCMTHRNSIVEQVIPELIDKREQLYQDLQKQCEAWLEEFGGEK